MPITNDYEFVCKSCHEPFQFFLPERTTLARFEKCREDVKQHNLPNTCECQNIAYPDTRSDAKYLEGWLLLYVTLVLTITVPVPTFGMMVIATRAAHVLASR
jgi:hypothetical protein